MNSIFGKFPVASTTIRKRSYGVGTRRKPGFWSVSSNRRNFLLEIQPDLNVRNWKDWYNVTYDQVKQLGGFGALAPHDHSLGKALADLIPEHKWQLWKFRSIPRGLFQDPRQRVEFVHSLEEEFNIKSSDDWYRISLRDIEKKGGGAVIEHHKNSLSNILKEAYPDHQWISARLDKWGVAYYRNPEHCKDFFDRFFVNFGLKDWEGWYDVTLEDIKNEGGADLLSNFEGAAPHIQALKAAYPMLPWKPWKFKNCSVVFRDAAIQRRFMEDAFHLLKFADWTDWYKLKVAALEDIGGGELLRYHGYSIVKAVTSLFPEHPWNLSLFEESMRSAREFFDGLAIKLGLNSLEDWYQVKLSTIEQYGGGVFLSHFPNYQTALQVLYPEFPWQVHRFQSVPSEYWSDPKNLRSFFDSISKDFQIKNLEDWYAVKKSKVAKLAAGPFHSTHGKSLLQLLKAAYPEHPWVGEGDAEATWNWYPSKVQIEIFNILSKLFPRDDAHLDFDYYFGESSSAEKVEVDIAIPTLNLAFEYHGEQHYVESDFFPHLSEQQIRDARKRKVLEQLGVALVEIPYWWDGTEKSLVATICSLRPDLAGQFKGWNLSELKPIGTEYPKALKDGSGEANL
eukprot:TRINITY_DN2104_c2_g1_i1.p1 TRINITY_DN2104_c2_g1~~TRINITY_DN2104_c2_g1_i1.p1  ORF type:complete len:621 (-),score=144.76 TRINITY_DN2104_c2_g1_i1:93-1955(-)